MRYLAPEYVYTAQGLQANMLITLAENGTIAAAAPLGETSRQEVGPIEYMPNVALLPGFVNVHSHVFQRALRGHTHRGLAQHSFWTWRRAMYVEAQRLTPESLHDVAVRTYHEMLAAGYTTVGEFHYVHHQPDGRPYAEPNAMAEAVITAGREVGIRVVLLMAAYVQGGFGQPPEEQQLRFCDASIGVYFERVEALRSAGVPIGLAPHSVRAVPRAWLRELARYSLAYGLPLHIHADEQLIEVEQCQQMCNCRPIEWLARCEVLGPLTTIIHATHATSEEIQLLARAQCNVCVCPTTEGDLGDGIAPYADLLAAHIPLSIGSDSNTRLDPLEELRWAEYSARMRYQRRRVLLAEQAGSPGPLLLEAGTRNGARALGVATGSIAPGMAADFVAIDLTHPALRGWTEQDLLDVLFFGASADVIAQTWVQGRCVSQHTRTIENKLTLKSDHFVHRGTAN
jgi:formimidoylglutamate deiminase